METVNLKHILATSLQKLDGVAGLEMEDIENAIEIPPESHMGDFAFPCFLLAKIQKKAPPIIAEEVALQIDFPFIEKVETVGAYINFFLKRDIVVSTVVKKVLADKEDFAAQNIGDKKVITMDFSSPNIAKSLHVGHLRSTVIGRSLYEIFKYLNFTPISINHLGDWGTQFGNLIVAYNKWSSRKAVEEKGIEELNRIYIKFGQEVGDNPDLAEEARLWFVKLEEGDTEAREIWQWFKDISMEMIEEFYDLLKLTMDYNTGESFYNDKMEAVVEELKEKNLLVEDDGALIVDLEAYDMPPAIVIRSDGGTLYTTRDLATAIYRKNTYDFYKSLYVTDAGQSLHFKQVFTVLKLMGYDWADDCLFLPFGLYLDAEGKKFSTREGTGVAMEDLVRESIDRTMSIIEEKNPQLENKEEVAKQVGVGAIIFSDLYNNRIKNITFSWENILNFEGEAGPYVQYTHARAVSVFEKGLDTYDEENVEYSLLVDDASFELAKLIAEFPEKVKESASRMEPYVVARQTMAVAQAYNRLYHENPILLSEPAVKNARLALTKTTIYALKVGMNLLGMEAPERM